MVKKLNFLHCPLKNGPLIHGNSFAVGSAIIFSFDLRGFESSRNAETSPKGIVMIQ